MLKTAAAFAVATIATLCAVQNAGWRLLVITLLGTIAYHAWARYIITRADDVSDKRRRSRRGTGTLLASMLLTGCRDEAPLTPEPEPADITAIECAGTCSITTASNSTIIWITE